MARTCVALAQDGDSHHMRILIVIFLAKQTVSKVNISVYKKSDFMEISDYTRKLSVNFLFKYLNQLSEIY